MATQFMAARLRAQSSILPSLQGRSMFPVRIFPNGTPLNDPAFRQKKNRNNYKDPEKKSRLIFGIECLRDLKNAPTRKIVKTRIDRNGVAQAFDLTTGQQIADFIGLPLRTLQDHYTQVLETENPMDNYSISSGDNTVLSTEIELEILRYADMMCKRGFPLDTQQLRLIALDVALEHGIEDFTASSGWLTRFKRRHEYFFAWRKPQSLELVRVGASNPDVIGAYFQLLSDVYADLRTRNGGLLEAQHIHNTDEVGWDMVTMSKANVIHFRFSKSKCRAQTSSDRTHITATAFVAADGHLYDPFFCMKGAPGTTDRSKLVGVSDGVGCVNTESAYQTEESWVETVKHFVKQKRDPNVWELVILDGYGPHAMSHKALQLFIDHKFEVVCMPSHTSHLLQVLDVACFRSTKNTLRFEMHELTRLVGPKTLTKWHTPMIFERAVHEGCRPANIISGFKAVGAWPLNMDWVKENMQNLEISEGLSTTERTSVADLDTAICPAFDLKDVAAAASEALTLLKSDLEKKGMEFPQALENLAQYNSSQLLPLAERLAKVFPEPVSVLPNKKRGRSDPTNALDESTFLARLLSKRARVQQLRDIIVNDVNRTNQEKLDQQVQALRKKQEKAEALQHEEPLRALLVKHHFLPEDHMGQPAKLTRSVLDQFINSNRAILSRLNVRKFKKQGEKRGDIINALLEKNITSDTNIAFNNKT